MANTGYARTMAPAQRYRRNLPERLAIGTEWETLEIWQLTPPSSEPWHVAAYCVADVDPGTVGQLRLRSSAASASSPAISDVYFSDFATVGSASVLGPEWEVYDSVGNAGFGFRRPAQVAVVNEATATSDGKCLRITAQNVGGQLHSGGVKLKVPQIYGQYEIRVRVSDDASAVTSGVVLLWPESNEWPRDGELDFWETFDNRTTRTPVKSYVHRLSPTATLPYDGADDQVVVEYTHTGIDQSDWHKIVCTWTPAELYMNIDNGPKVLLTADPAHIPDWPMELCLQLDAWSSTPPGSPVTMDVDYVVVRELGVSGISPAVDVSAFTRNVRLGFEGITNTPQLLYVEGRRASGTGGMRLARAAVTAVSAPPAGLITSTVPAVSTGTVYAWENRPSYVEPNPAAAAGTPEKALADSLGLLRRVVVNSQASFQAARSTAAPGDQIYISTTITGTGGNRVIDWYGTNAPAGGGGTDVSGTATNPIMITCAPNVWIDGGLAAGAEDLNGRGVYLVGANHLWLYGCNIRRANFLATLNQCAGTLTAPIRIWYCNFQDSAHSMLAIAGNFGAGGSSAFVSVKYNLFDNSGLANQMFGEGVYIGYGSTNSPTLQQNHDITIEANKFTRLTAESCDMKAGSQKVYFRYNLIQDCGDHATPARTGDAANIGFPGAFQFPGHTTPPVGWSAQSEVIGNRFKNITSASTKFPDGLVILGARGFKCIGNLFTEINVGSAGLVVFYLDGNVPMNPGDTGTNEVHNNTARDCNSMNALYRVTNAGASQPALLAIMNANSNHSNNVRANSPSAATGADYSVTDAAFADDGTGYPGGVSAVALGGALDVTGADTSAQWAGAVDYAGRSTTAPVNPGARQVP